MKFLICKNGKIGFLVWNANFLCSNFLGKILMVFLLFFLCQKLWNSIIINQVSTCITIRICEKGSGFHLLSVKIETTWSHNLKPSWFFWWFFGVVYLVVFWWFDGCWWLKSLTSEATPSATQFFKRSYKISHNPGL